MRYFRAEGFLFRMRPRLEGVTGVASHGIAGGMCSGGGTGSIGVIAMLRQLTIRYEIAGKKNQLDLAKHEQTGNSLGKLQILGS